MSNIETHDIDLQAGLETRMGGYGTQFLLMEAAHNVSVRFMGSQGQTVGNVTNCPAGLAVSFEEPFTYAVIQSPVNQAIKIAFASGAAQFNRISGNVTAAIQQATELTEAAPETIGTAAVLLLAADTTRKRVVFRADPANTGNIGLGSSAVTMANSVFILDEAGFLADSDAAAAEWWGIADAAGQIIRIQEAF